MIDYFGRDWPDGEHQVWYYCIDSGFEPYIYPGTLIVEGNCWKPYQTSFTRRGSLLKCALDPSVALECCRREIDDIYEKLHQKLNVAYDKVKPKTRTYCYIGKEDHLIGHKIVGFMHNGTFHVQVNDPTHPWAYGQHPARREDWDWESYSED